MATEGSAELVRLALSEDDGDGDFFEPWVATHCLDHPGSWRRDCVACLSWQLAQAVNVAGVALTSYMAWAAAVLTTQQTARNAAGDKLRAALKAWRDDPVRANDPAELPAAVAAFLSVIDEQVPERLAAFEALRTGHTVGFDAAVIMDFRLPESDRRMWLEHCANMVDVGAAG